MKDIESIVIETGEQGRHFKLTVQPTDTFSIICVDSFRGEVDYYSTKNISLQSLYELVNIDGDPLKKKADEELQKENSDLITQISKLKADLHTKDSETFNLRQQIKALKEVIKNG